jgi:uncharacterized protein DUF4347
MKLNMPVPNRNSGGLNLNNLPANFPFTPKDTQPSPQALNIDPRLALALEPRFMFDAAGLATAVAADDASAHDTQVTSADTADAQKDTAKEAERMDSLAAALIPPATQATEAELDKAILEDGDDLITRTSTREVVFIDASVTDTESFLNNIPAGAELVTINSDRDGLTQIAEWLKNYDDISAIHIISHGDDGNVQLGNTIINNDNLGDYTDQLASIGDALTSDGDILFYGCNLGETDQGLKFIEQLAFLTDADIAASDDVTGAAELGGDWELEIATGTIEANQAFSAEAMKGFSSALLIPGPVTFDTYTGGVSDNSGNNATYTNGAYTVVLDGATSKTYSDDFGVAPGYAATALNETQLTVSITGYTFDTTGLDISNTGGASRTFTITSNVGGDTYMYTIASGTTETLTLAGFNDITNLIITPNAATGFYVDNLVTSNVTAGGANTAPTINLGGTTAVTVTEDVQTDINLSALTFADADGDNLTVSLTADAGTIASAQGNVVTGGVTISGSGTSSLVLDGSAANINTYLDTTTNIKYTTPSNDNTANSIAVSVFDGTAQDATNDSITVNITPANDAPAITAGATTNYTLNAAAEVVDATTPITDVDDTNIESATITISSVDRANDLLTLNGAATTAAAGATITVTAYNTGTGVLTLSGTATKAVYESVLQGIQFSSTSGNATNRSVDFVVNDGDVNSGAGTATMNVSAAGNTAPTIASLNGDSVTYNEGDNPVLIDLGSNATVTDGDSSDFDGGNLTFTVAVNADPSEDLLGLDTSGSVSLAATTAGSNVLVGGTIIGTLGNNIANGNDLVVNLNTNATAANVQTLVRALTYQNTNTDNPVTTSSTLRVTINDGDGGTSSNSDITLNLNAINDDPTVSGLPTDVTVTEDTASDLNLSASAFADVDAGGSDIVVTLGAGAGTLTASDFGGVLIGNSGTASITLTGTVTEINTYLDTASRVQYTGVADAQGDNVTTLTVTANDGGNTGTGGGTNVALGTVNIDITNVNDVPTTTNLNGDNVTYNEGDAAKLLDVGSDAIIADGDNDFDGGNLTVTVTGGVFAEDLFSLNTGGTVALAGTTAGSNVSVGGTVIGTLANNISGGNDLVVNFNANATSANVQTLVRALTYQNTNTDNPSAGSVTVRVTINDGDGGTSANADITLNVNAVNDVPTTTNLNSDRVIVINGDTTAKFLDAGSNAILADVDSTNFDGGNLTVTITSGEDATEDQLGISTASGVTLSSNLDHGSTITVGGTVIGTIVAVGADQVDVGEDLVINLNANATPAKVQTLVRSLTYQNIDAANPTLGERNVRVTVTDGDGGTSANADITVDMVKPEITSATYNLGTNLLTVAGTDFVAQAGANNDIDLSKLTFTGEGGAIYTLTSATDVEVISETEFSVTLSGADETEVEKLLNEEGTTSDDNTTYNLAAADGWLAAAVGGVDISDTTGNAITVDTNVEPPTFVSIVPIGAGSGISLKITVSDPDTDAADLTLELRYNTGARIVQVDANGNPLVVDGKFVIKPVPDEVRTYVFNEAFEATVIFTPPTHVSTYTFTVSDGFNTTVATINITRTSAGSASGSKDDTSIQKNNLKFDEIIKMRDLAPARLQVLRAGIEKTISTDAFKNRTKEGYKQGNIKYQDLGDISAHTTRKALGLPELVMVVAMGGAALWSRWGKRVVRTLIPGKSL